jgi:threonyl-tRNA synthetase
VLGAKEVEAGLVSVRSRADRSMDGTMPLDDFLARVLAEVRERRLRVPAPVPAAPAKG